METMRTLRERTPVVRSAARRFGRLALLPALVLLALSVNVRAADATYLFEVTTGAVTGDESKIEFFIISYVDTANEEHIQLLYPFEDSLKESYERAVAVNGEQQARDSYIRSTYGYEGIDLVTRTAFQAYQTDQYIFTLPVGVKTVSAVQVFTSGSGSWACQGIRLFRVDKLGGLYRGNDASNDGYVDFEGVLLAEGAKGENIGWSTDRLTGISLQTSFDEAYAKHELQHDAGKTLAVRFDFADSYGAGLESLATSPSDADKTIRGMGLAETAALTLRYTDRYGAVRETNVPVVLNAAEWAIEKGAQGDASLIGLAQQGESMAVGVFLPDYASLNTGGDMTLTLGASEAEKVLSFQTTGISSRREASASDTANIVTVAVYELAGTDVKATIDSVSGTIRYQYVGDPVAYHMATSIGGEQIKIGSNRIQLRPYEHGSRLTPADSTERYLIEIDTDDVPNADTTGELLLSIGYTDLEGNKKSTEELDVRSYALDFYGYWPGSRDALGYYANITRGRTLRFFIPIQNVRSITDVKARLNGSDDWQMRDLRLYTVTAFDKRSVSWSSLSVGGMTSDRVFDRYVECELKYAFADKNTGPILIWPGSEPESVGPGSSGSSGTNSNSGGGSGTNGDSDGIDVIGRNGVDWSQIRHSMTLQQASQELGFKKARCQYTVTVNVKDDVVTDSLYGDCGSKNLFYFRLVFQNGTSAFVLANQQLHSDGFRSGKPESFDVATNQDYGDVVAVQIIPDDLSGNSDMYDKLNIDSIQVKRHSNSALTPTWTINNVGWIGIDYHDDAESQSVGGRDGRTQDELAHVYMVDSSSYSANLLVAITTDKYKTGDPQFKGTLSAEVHYDTTSLPNQKVTVSDVVKLMYEYTNHNHSETMGALEVSDPDLMFREGHTDRFILSLNDVRTVRNIEFFARGENATTWNIANVTIGLINGTGKLAINLNGEYEQTYNQGAGLTYQTTCTSESSPAYSQFIPKGDSAVRPQAINVYFNEVQIELSPDAKQWSSTLSRAPVSENDTLNLYLFPQTLDAATASAGYDLSAVAQYTDAWARPQQTATGIMSKTLYNGRPVYYATGLNAKAMSTLTALYFRTENASTATMVGIERGIVQQVRNGVVVNAWDLAGPVTVADGGVPLSDRATTLRDRQRVLLQLGTDTIASALEAQKTDLAVAIWYRGDDPSAQEFRSPYVYLTDGKKYSEIHPGQLIELEFDQLNVAEITGISVAAAGSLSATVDAAWADCRQIGIEDSSVVLAKGEYSFAQPLVVANVPYRMDPSGTVKPLELTFTSDAATESANSGTNGPVRMTLGFYNEYGDLRSVQYQDIRQYIEGNDKRFLAGSSTTIRLLTTDTAELRWVELEPYRETQDTSITKAMWNLKELTAVLGENGVALNRSVGRLIVEGEPLRVSMADILLTVDVFTGSDTEAQKLTGGTMDIQLKSGESLTIVPTLTGSVEGLDVKLESLDPATGATGQADLGDTRGYTAENLERKAAEAAGEEEAKIWRETQPQPGRFDTSDPARIVFTPPCNYTESSLCYRVTIRSREATALSIVVNVTVSNETDPTKKTIEDFMQEMLRIQQENQEKMRQMQEQIDKRN